MENNNLEVIETTNVEVIDECVAQPSGGKISKGLIGLTMAVGAGLGILIYKRRKNRKERMIKLLEKEGYTITKESEVEIDDETVEEN